MRIRRKQEYHTVHTLFLSSETAEARGEYMANCFGWKIQNIKGKHTEGNKSEQQMRRSSLFDMLLIDMDRQIVRRLPSYSCKL